MGKTPQKWGHYSKHGQIMDIGGVKFVALKVLLIDKVWNMSSLMSKVPGISHIIDLTNYQSDKYSLYKEADFQRRNLGYTKVAIPPVWSGYQPVPPEQSVQDYFDAVDEALENMDDVDDVIGVMCSFGVDRSGYMLCRYMMDRDGMDSEAAIEKFTEARSEQFSDDRGHWVEDLRDRDNGNN